MDTPCCDVPNPKKINQAEVIARPLGNFSPSLWGDCFTTLSLDNELWEKYSAEVEELKEEVRRMLLHEDREPHLKMVLIDTLERLGVAYHFEDEIEVILQQLFANFEYEKYNDLYNVALHFRIFRQHGYDISSDIFNQFKGSDGKLKETWTNDVMGILSLYEAANLAKHGDDILDEALSYTKIILQSALPNLSFDIAEQVKRSLHLCLHRSLPRIEARNYIDVYGKIPLRNETLLRFAKTDYNFLQLLHLQELSSISKWWNNHAPKFPYARDRIVEGYLWGVGVYFEPRYTESRIALTKIMAMISVLDDTFDSYGTLDELEVLTQAIEGWDASAIEILPDDLKILYKFILDLLEEIEQHFMTAGRSNGVSHVKQQVKNLAGSYYIEARWLTGGNMPSFDDYLTNGFVTSTYLLAAPTSFLGMKEASTDEEAFDWLRNRPKALLASATIGRMLDDIVSHEREKASGQLVTGIDCYMYQYGVSRDDTIKEFNRITDEAWKDLNDEVLNQTVSKHLLERIVNLARLVEVVYRDGDGYTEPEVFLKDIIIKFLKNPIPLT